MTAGGPYWAGPDWAGTRWITPYGLEHLNKVADLLGVAERDRRKFVETIAVIVLGANLKSELAGTDSQLLAAAKAVRTARGAVAKLTREQRWKLSAILRNPGHWYWESFVFEDDLALSVIDRVDQAFGDFVGRSHHASPGRRGKPSGAKTQWVMHDFVDKLWQFSCLCGGNGLTLSNSGGRAGGSIVEMLNLLKPMLPEQFFPGVLNYSFLRKVQKSLPHYIIKWKHLGERARYHQNEFLELWEMVGEDV